MPTAPQIFHNFLLPALIVAAGLSLGWFPFRRRARNGRWLGAITISAAFIVADCGISGSPTWPPGTGDAAYWLIWFAVAIALLGFLDAWLSPPTWLRAGILFVLIRIAAAELLSPLLAHMTPADTTIDLDGMALIAVLWWLAWETLAERLPGPGAPLLLMIVLGASAAVLALANDIKPSQAVVALTGTAAAALVAGWLWPTMSLTRGAMLAWTIPLLAFLVLIHFYYYTEPPVISVVLLLIAPLLAFIGDLVSPGRKRLAFRLIPVVLALAAAVGFSVRDYLHASAATEKSAGQNDY